MTEVIRRREGEMNGRQEVSEREREVRRWDERDEAKMSGE